MRVVAEKKIIIWIMKGTGKESLKKI